MKLFAIVNFMCVDEGFNFDSFNQLGDFWGRIRRRAYFLKGRGGPYMDLFEWELRGSGNIILLR